MFLYAVPGDPTRVSSEELSSGDLDRALSPLLKFKAGEDLPGESLTPPLSTSKGASKVKFVCARCAFLCVFCLLQFFMSVVIFACSASRLRGLCSLYLRNIERHQTMRRWTPSLSFLSLSHRLRMLLRRARVRPESDHVANRRMCLPRQL